MPVLVAGTEYDVLVAGTLQDILIAGTEYSSGDDTPADTFPLSGLTVTGELRLAVKLRIGRSARTNGRVQQLHIWTPAGSGFEPAVGEILEGSMDYTTGGVTTDDLIRRIFIEDRSSTDHLNRPLVNKWFGLNRTDGLSISFTTDVFPTSKVTMVKPAGELMTIDENDWTAGNDTYVRWERETRGEGVDEDGLSEEEAEFFVTNLAAGDEIIFALHTGDASYTSTPTPPTEFTLSDWALPAGKVAVSGPVLIEAAEGAGTGGYPLGLYEREHNAQGLAGFGTILDGTFTFPAPGLTTDTLDEIKYDLDGAANSGSAYRLAVSRHLPDTGDGAAGSIRDWLSGLTNGQFIIQTPSRTMVLDTDASTDRSQGSNWVSWHIHGSTRAGFTIWLDADDITELNRLRDEGGRFIAAFVEDA